MDRTISVLVHDLKTAELLEAADSISEAINSYLNDIGVGEGLHNLGYTMQSSVFYLLLSENSVGVSPMEFASNVARELVLFVATVLEDTEATKQIDVSSLTPPLSVLEDAVRGIILSIHEYASSTQYVMKAIVAEKTGLSDFEIVNMEETNNGVVIEVMSDH